MKVSRVSKIVFVAAVAIFMSLTVVNNITDYQTNFDFVRHVCSMDTVPSESRLHWRAVTNEHLHRAVYGCIIAWETLTAVMCWGGVIQLCRSMRSDSSRFHQAKSLAVFGLVLGLLLWLVAFLCVGGEWFAMWLSPTWNGQNAAFRPFVVTGVILLYLTQPELDSLRTE